MSILDEREPTVSLKLIVVVVSLVAFGAIGTMLAVSGVANVPHEASKATQQTL